MTSAATAKAALADQLVAALIDVGRPAMLDAGLIQNSCVAATRVGLEAALALNVRFDALLVQVAAFNKVFMDELNSGNEQPLSNPAAWSCAAGYDEVVPGAEFGGHLIGVLDGNLAIDLSIDQMARPEHGMNIHPWAYRVPDDFLKGSDSLTLTDPDGCVMMYSLPDRATARRLTGIYKASTDWKRPKLVQEIAATVVDHVRSASKG